jgi:23S rRNA (uracil1939-C5)-methyltransferase
LAELVRLAVTPAAAGGVPDCPLEPGAFLPRLVITDLTVDGRAVARHEGRVIFLENGLPEDVVSARVTAVEKRIVRARVENILAPSPFRVKPWCPHFPACGACLWLDLAPERLRAWKENHVRQTLRRLGGQGDIPVEPLCPSPLQREYRNKMVFAVGPTQTGEIAPGLRKRSGREILEVPFCALPPAPVMAVLRRLRQRIPDLGFQSYLRFLVFHAPAYRLETRSQLILECITGPEEEEGEAARLRRLGAELREEFSLTGFIHSEQRRFSLLARGERVVSALGGTARWETFGHLLLETPHTCFMQTNTRATEHLYARIRELADMTGRETLWDLYCGAGAVGLYLAPEAGAVWGFDIRKDAIEAARANARRLSFPQCRFFAGDLRHTLPAAAREGEADVLVVDPPRAGLGAEIADLLNRLPAKRLIYVSCDVGTQARDLARLSRTWRAERAWPVDMFPHGPHLENILLFFRRPPQPQTARSGPELESELGTMLA